MEGSMSISSSQSPIRRTHVHFRYPAKEETVLQSNEPKTYYYTILSLSKFLALNDGENEGLLCKYLKCFSVF